MLNIFENIGNMLENIGNYARKCQKPFVLTYLFVDDISSRRGYAGFSQNMKLSVHSVHRQCYNKSFDPVPVPSSLTSCSIPP